MAAITAGTWLLESTVEDATTESFFPDEQSETVFFPDKRVLVDSVDFATGGELRCKLFCHLYEVKFLHIYLVVHCILYLKSIRLFTPPTPGHQQGS